MDHQSYRVYNDARRCADKRSLCHAPTYGMYLAQNGTVLACCLARLDPLGHYPEQSLMEIWFGEKAQTMRQAMLSGEFPQDCHMCRADAEAKLFERMHARDFDSLALKPFQKKITRIKNLVKTGHYGEYPRSMSFELSNTCNLECVMCLGMLSSSIRQNRDKLPPLPQKYGQELLPQLRPFIPHLKDALFFGGEPFLIPLYLDIWELLSELNPNCRICITTNGTVLNNRVKRIIDSLPNFEIVVSLDAVTKETYEKIRLNAQFEQAMQNIRYFKSASEKFGRKLMVKAVMMTLNCREYQMIYDFANREKITFDVGIAHRPPELSLANLNVAELEEIHASWANHQPAPCSDPALATNNARAFQMAIDQVAFWLEEQRQFRSHPQGGLLAVFQPHNLMELCLSKLLSHSLRTTQDIERPLRLMKLWATPEPKALAWCDALLSLCNHLYRDGDRLRTETIGILKARIEASFDDKTQMQLTQHLLNLPETWKPVELLNKGDIEGLWEIIVLVSGLPPLPKSVLEFLESTG